jgi:hypothetical protein
MKQISWIIIISSFLTPCFSQQVPLQIDRPIQLKKISAENFEKQFSSYSIKQSNKKLGKFLLYSIAGVSALIGSGLLIKYTCCGETVDKTEDIKKEKDSNSKKQEKLSKRALDYTVITIAATLGLSLTASVYNTLSGFISYLFERSFGKQSTIIKNMFALTNIIESSINRIKNSIVEIQNHPQGEFFHKYYLSELINAFSVFTDFLEEFCVVFLHEMKKRHGNNKSMLLSSIGTVQRLFLFCNKIANQLAEDLNAEEWNGFNENSLILVDKLKQECFDFVSFFGVLNNKK